MGNVSLKALEKALNFLFKNGYEPCTYHPVLAYGTEDEYSTGVVVTS